MQCKSFDELLHDVEATIQAATLHHTLQDSLKHLTNSAGDAAVLKWRFLINIGPVVYTKYRQDVSWVLDRTAVVEMLLCSGDVEDWDVVMSTLISLVEDNGHSTLNLPLAAAIALSAPLKSFADKRNLINVVNRYKSFSQWLNDGELFPLTLQCWHWRYIVNSWAEDCELEWARRNVPPEFKTSAKIGEGTHRMMSYKLHNIQGVSVHEGGAYYNNQPVTLQKMVEVGGVCGAVSKVGVGMAQAFGVPALPVGQPGHCAFMWWKEGKWVVSTDVSGLDRSHVHDGVRCSWRREACYIILMEAAQKQFDQYSESERIRALAEIITDKSLSFEMLEHATTVCPYNFRAWEDLIACLDRVKKLNISSVDFTINLPNLSTISLTSHDTLEDMKHILTRKVKQLLLPAHIQVTMQIVKMIRGAGYLPISDSKLCTVSECSERAGNLTDGTGSEWWSRGTSAWVELDLLHLYTVSEVGVQWWGVSVSRKYKVLAGDGGLLEEVRCERDAELSPGEGEYNAWSAWLG